MAKSEIHPTVLAVLTAAGIPYHPPDHPEYVGLQANWACHPGQPLIIIRPQTAAQVVDVVSACVTSNSEFVIRSGGHDLAGRSMIGGIVQIDLRLLNQVGVAEDKKTAWIGGGANLFDVLGALGKEGLVTPVGSVGSVGYIGWATMGGYGPYSPTYGLGADQIVGARVVNAEGILVEASERMLKAMRGGGPGNWGVVVEVQVKVYPLSEVVSATCARSGMPSDLKRGCADQKATQIQAGALVFDSSDLRATIETYLGNFNKMLATNPIPRPLTVHPLVLNLPSGKVFLVTFFWSGPATPETGVWQERIASLGPCVAQDIKSTTPLAQLTAVTGLIPTRSYGCTETVSLRYYSPSAATALADAAAAMPNDPGAGISVHSLETCSPSCQDRDDATFLVRQQHYMVEIVGFSIAPETSQVTRSWAAEARETLAAAEGAMEATYFPLTRARMVDLKKIFGKHLDELRELKEELDPKGVFKHAIPQL
jgi:FAD/FMN-containing dehydrogenase